MASGNLAHVQRIQAGSALSLEGEQVEAEIAAREKSIKVRIADTIKEGEQLDKEAIDLENKIKRV